MSNVTQFPQNESRRLVEASGWIAALERGLSEDEEQRLGEWLSRDTANFEPFMELATFWDRMDSLQKLSTIFPEPSRKPRFGAKAAGLAIAASVVAAVVLQLNLPRDGSGLDPDMTPVNVSHAVVYETAVGEHTRYGLADGSELSLNTNSRVHVDFTATARLLRLERGEIHVKVAHDPVRPLSVMVGSTVIQAVGTEFNVEITQDKKIELLVTEGLVMVGVMDARAEIAATEPPVLLHQDSRLVSSGEKAVISAEQQSKDRIDATPVDRSEVAVELSWREGNLIFRGESLEEAVHEVGRYTAIEFVILDEKAKKVRVAGMFKAGDVEGLLTALRSHFDIIYEMDGEDRILLSTK